MTLNRLTSTTGKPLHDVAERAHQTPADRVRRVEAIEAVAADRQRSVQQELAEVAPKAAGPFKGCERISQDARQVATQLVLLGTHANGLIKLHALSLVRKRVDDKA
jgi:hypothetical protein